MAERKQAEHKTGGRLTEGAARMLQFTKAHGESFEIRYPCRIVVLGRHHGKIKLGVVRLETPIDERDAAYRPPGKASDVITKLV